MGFQFLLTGGLSDPLPDYEHMFTDLEDEPATWRRIARKVLRFPDPKGQRDAADRDIPHEFVVFGDLVARAGNC